MIHARTERGLEESGGLQILHPPPVQFKLYQGEVLRRGLYQGLGGKKKSTQSETPEGTLESSLEGGEGCVYY